MGLLRQPPLQHGDRGRPQPHRDHRGHRRQRPERLHADRPGGLLGAPLRRRRQPAERRAGQHSPDHRRVRRLANRFHRGQLYEQRDQPLQLARHQLVALRDARRPSGVRHLWQLFGGRLLFAVESHDRGAADRVGRQRHAARIRLDAESEPKSFAQSESESESNPKPKSFTEPGPERRPHLRPHLHDRDGEHAVLEHHRQLGGAVCQQPCHAGRDRGQLLRPRSSEPAQLHGAD